MTVWTERREGGVTQLFFCLPLLLGAFATSLVASPWLLGMAAASRRRRPFHILFENQTNLFRTTPHGRTQALNTSASCVEPDEVQVLRLQERAATLSLWSRHQRYAAPQFCY